MYKILIEYLHLYFLIYITYIFFYIYIGSYILDVTKDLL